MGCCYVLYMLLDEIKIMRVLLLKVFVMVNSYNSLKLEGIFNVDM